MEHEIHHHNEEGTHEAHQVHHHGHVHGRRTHMKKVIVGVGAATLVTAALVGGYIAVRGNPFSYQYPPNLPEQLREKTHAAVATVNGEDVDRDAFNSMLASIAEMAVQQGASLDDATTTMQIKRSALDAIISNKLLMQAAAAENIIIEDSKVDEQVLATQLRLGGEDAFMAELEKVSLTAEKYRATVKDQLVLDAYIEKVAPRSGVTVTDAEAKAFYDARIKTAPAGTDIPKFATVLEQIREYLVGEKYQKVIAAHIATLREKAEIKELLTLE